MVLRPLRRPKRRWKGCTTKCLRNIKLANWKSTVQYRPQCRWFVEKVKNFNNWSCATEEEGLSSKSTFARLGKQRICANSSDVEINTSTQSSIKGKKCGC